MMSSDRVIAAIALGSMILAVAVKCTGPVRAQDGIRNHGHAENHDWYRDLKTNSGYSCCNGSEDGTEGDCRPGAVWRDDRGNVWTRIAGKTIAVPAYAVLPDTMNKVPLTGHICERQGYFYCALVGGAGG
jgi:hypothetical protein